MPEEIIPVVAILVVFGAPITAYIINSLLRHQREMAERLNRNTRDDAVIVAEIKALREEVAALKETVLSHSLSLDTSVDTVRRRLDEISG